jgi:dinuclear metal center YbgI/SA1388 family protein
MHTPELEQFLKTLLRPELFDDYCPNGLQVEGKPEIQKILFAVSATRESAEYAVKIKADALIVHHGLFWKFHGSKTLTGPFYKRVAPLIKDDINLFGYHLPLDAHNEVGNAVSLANLIQMDDLSPFGNYKGAFTGVMGVLKAPLNGIELKKLLEAKLNHLVHYSNPIEGKKIRRIGIITGGANSQWSEAYKLGLDAYITGEMSEHDYHESREAGIHMFAGGHHATEKFGIMALMKKIQSTYPDLTCEYLDSENPA